MRIKVGVVFGGPSVEHEISIISAIQAMKSMDSEKYEVIPIYIAKDRTWYTGNLLMDLDLYKHFEDLKKYATKVTLYNKKGSYVLQSLGLIKRVVNTIDIIFPIVHGANVEDGSLQGYLELVGVPYVGSNIIGSALGQDKVIMKQIFSESGIPVVPYTWFYDNEYLEDASNILKAIKKISYPVIVKPATLGSSVGITVCKSEKEIDDAILEAIKYDKKIVVEKLVSNLTEVNCSVLGYYEKSEVSAIEEVMTSEDFLTYKDKYMGKGTKGNTKGMVNTNRIIPANLSDSTKNEIERLSKEVFRVLNLSGICRIDFLIDKKNNDIYVNEPNTIPGSLAYYLWAAKDMPYSKLLDEAINIGIKNYKLKARKVTSFDINILSNYNGLKGMKK